MKVAGDHALSSRGKSPAPRPLVTTLNNVSLLAFILATYFGKLFDGKGLQFGGNVFKTLARHVHASVIALPKAVLQR